MDFGIAGKTALLLSSTQGLGFGCAQALVNEGVRVVINGRNAERGRDAAAKLGENARFIQADITQPDERARLFEEASAFLGMISILVTNADGPSGGAFLSKESGDWQNAFDLVLQSALDLVRRCVPGMIEQGFGRIVNISSTSAKETTPGPILANALKPALLGALGTLAREVAATGVTVNSILPGPFDTDRMRQMALHVAGSAGLTPEQAIQKWGETRPMKRVGSIDEIGALCAFLCSRKAGYITGQSIVIDGGQVTTLL